MNKPERELNLQEIFLFLWQHVAVILLCMVVCAGAMVGLTTYQSSKSPSCQATALLTFDIRTAAEAGPDAGDQFGYYSNITNMVSVIVQSDTVLAPVAEKLSLSLADLKGQVSVSSVSNSSFMQLTVTGSDQELVHQICTEILALLPQASAEMTSLGTLRAVSEVTVAATASSSPVKSALIGAVLGAILGIVVLVGIELFDRRLHDAGDVTYYLDLPVLGVIPAANSKSAPLREEAWRSVRTRLQPALQKASHPLLAVAGTDSTSPLADAEQLAHTFAHNGKTVLLVDADRQAADETFGLSDLLDGKVSVQDVPCKAKDDHVFLLSFGHRAKSLSDLLSTASAESVWAALREKYDCIIVSVPNAGGSADAAAVSRFADGTLLVLRADTTPIESAQLAKEKLSGAPAPLLGAVLCGYRREKALRRDGYYYALTQ